MEIFDGRLAGSGSKTAAVRAYRAALRVIAISFALYAVLSRVGCPPGGFLRPDFVLVVVESIVAGFALLLTVLERERQATAVPFISCCTLMAVWTSTTFGVVLVPLALLGLVIRLPRLSSSTMALLAILTIVVAAALPHLAQIIVSPNDFYC